MPIPYRDVRDPADMGLAGFLRIAGPEPARTIHGALFLVNARGEPVEFTYSSIDLVASFLWRGGEVRRNAIATLIAALFEACPRAPSVLLGLADEIPALLFTEDIVVEIPVCLVAENAGLASPEDLDDASGQEDLNVFWVGPSPEAGTPGRAVFERLRGRRLLLEPFERAALGIEEAQSDA
jgi:hypothetical protein